MNEAKRFHVLFIQSFWRSSSTYIWSKLRKADDVACFYEPFHELFHRGTKEIPIHGAGQWESGHPPEVEDYFKEYRDLAVIDTLSPPQQAYEFLRECYYDCNTSRIEWIYRLAMSAKRQGFTNVCFCCTRGIASNKELTRSMHEKLPNSKVSSILLERRAYEQFAAACEIWLRGNNAFFVCGHALPLVNTYKELSRDLGLRPDLIIQTGNTPASVERYYRYTANAIEIMAKSFIANVAISRGLAKESFDQTININKGLEKPEARKKAERHLTELCGTEKTDISLEDFKYSAKATMLSAKRFQELSHEVKLRLQEHRVTFDCTFVERILSTDNPQARAGELRLSTGFGESIRCTSRNRLAGIHEIELVESTADKELGRPSAMDYCTDELLLHSDKFICDLYEYY